MSEGQQCSHATLRKTATSRSRTGSIFFPQGAAPSELSLPDTGKCSLTRDEAALVALLPIKPFNIAPPRPKIWKKARRRIPKDPRGPCLQRHAAFEHGDARRARFFLFLPPPHGPASFEFSMMRHRQQLRTRSCSPKLFYQYLKTWKRIFVPQNLFCRPGETPTGPAHLSTRKPLAADSHAHGDGLRKEASESHPNRLCTWALGACLFAVTRLQHMGKSCKRPHGHLH